MGTCGQEYELLPYVLPPSSVVLMSSASSFTYNMTLSFPVESQFTHSPFSLQTVLSNLKVAFRQHFQCSERFFLDPAEQLKG